MTESAKGRILVVDDESALRTLAEMTLAEEGYDVLTAADADSALEIAKQRLGEIDLFIIDVVMPGTPGPELAEALKKEQPEIPVVFTSGYGEAAGVALRQRDASAVYLKKPFSPSDLVALVDRMLDSAAG